MMSRNIGILATVIAVLLSIAACVDGPTGQSNDRDIMGSKLLPPPPQRVVFSYSLIGTTWAFSFAETDRLSTTLDFLQDGRFHQRLTNSEDGVLVDPTPNDDKWEQDGPSVRITYNDGYATAIGNLAWDSMYRTTSNIKGDTWTWRARRLR